MAVVLLSGPASNDDVGGEGNEQRQEEDAAEWEAQIDGTLRCSVRVCRDEEWDYADEQEQQADRDQDVAVPQKLPWIFRCGNGDSSRMDRERVLPCSLLGVHSMVSLQPGGGEQEPCVEK